MKAKLTEKDERFLHESLNGSMWKVVLSVGTPLALYQGLSILFTILDTMMAAHISKESVSAVAYLSQINAILSAVGGGLAVGAGVQISRACGEGSFLLVRKRVSSLYALCLGAELLIPALILPFARDFLRLAGTPEKLIDVGAQYFVVEMFDMVVKFLNNVYIAVERARGDSRRIMLLNFMVIGVKLSLTALFVYGMRGGLTMIAVASLISQLSLLAFGIRHSLRADEAFSFSREAVAMDRRTVMPNDYAVCPGHCGKGAVRLRKNGGERHVRDIRGYDGGGFGRLQQPRRHYHKSPKRLSRRRRRDYQPELRRGEVSPRVRGVLCDGGRQRHFGRRDFVLGALAFESVGGTVRQRKRIVPANDYVGLPL